MRRPTERRLVLGGPRIRAANGTDIAITPGLGGEPFDGVVAVAEDAGSVVSEWVKFTVRSEPAAHVLDDYGVAPPGKEFGRADRDLRAPILIVRRALQQDRKRAGGVRAGDIRAQDSAVAHRHFDILFEHGFVLGLGQNVWIYHRVTPYRFLRKCFNEAIHVCMIIVHRG